MMKSNVAVLIVVISIIIVGLIGIPFGNPRLVGVAILLEILYISLAALITKGYSKALYACIILAIIIIIGNSLTPQHIHRMMTFSKPLNTVVLIIGGYILQGLLIYISIRAIKYNRSHPLITSSKL
jgi:hypothetical protein